MSIREALSSDLSRIGELGSRSLRDGPYAGIIEDNPAKGKEFAAWMIEHGCILLGENDDGKIVGLLAFIVTDHHFSGQRYASELMWYVEPEHREGGIAMKLLWDAELKAKELGAKSMVFTAPNADVASLYRRFGYKQLEVAFKKEL